MKTKAQLITGGVWFEPHRDQVWL